MLDNLRHLYQFDWQIFMAATKIWSQGGNPYGALPTEFGPPGAFAYPPIALPWLWLFLGCGAAGFYAWTMLQLAGWWLLVRRRFRSQVVLVAWVPLLVHLLLGQSTLGIILVLWAATLAHKRSFWWGVALAWTLSKPQTAALPLLWLLWQDRSSATRGQLWLGLAAGLLALAIPPTVMNPLIWRDWLQSLIAYRALIQNAVPWQGFGSGILLVSAWLWHRSQRHSQQPKGWQWWLTAALFPQAGLGVYTAVVLLPALRPRQSYWTITGLWGSMLLLSPLNQFSMPIILASQVLVAWFISGGPRFGTADESYRDAGPPKSAS